MRLRVMIAAVAAVPLLIVIVCLLLLYSARNSLNHGIDTMHVAEAQLHVKNLQRSPQTALRLTRQAVLQAHDDFQSAGNKLDPIAPLLERLGWVPRVGQDMAAAPVAARTAAQLTSGMLPLLHGLQPIVAGFHAGGRAHSSISSLVGQLAASRAEFDRSCALLEQARGTREQLKPYHSPRLTSAVRTIDRQLPNLLRVCNGLRLAPRILGNPVERSYFVAYQDPQELRATGGFIGSAGMVYVHNGVSRQEFQSTGLDHENETVPSPEPVQFYNYEPFWYLRDSNWSPDFPTSAALERYFVNIDLHRTAQGVINITPTAASDVLKATGPIYSREYQRWITADNVAQLADYYTHWSPVPGPLQLSNAGNARKQFIQIVAQHVIKRLNSLSTSQWVQLIQNMSSAVAARDVQLNFSDPQEQALIRQLGADGRVNRTTSDYLFVVDTNLSYNKINPYVHINESYHVRVRPDRWLQAELTLQIKDGPVPAALLSHGIGPGAGVYGHPLDYADFVRIYVPAGAQLIDQSGWKQPWTGGPAYGKTMFCGYVIVPNGETRTVRLQYVVPPNVFTWSGGQRYRLLVQHQAGSHPDRLDVALDTGRSGRRWSVSSPARDWQRTVPIASAPFHPIPLPAAPPTVVAPGNLIEPHAFLQAAK